MGGKSVGGDPRAQGRVVVKQQGAVEREKPLPGSLEETVFGETIRLVFQNALGEISIYSVDEGKLLFVSVMDNFQEIPVGDPDEDTILIAA